MSKCLPSETEENRIYKSQS